MLDLVGNPKDRFSHVAAHLVRQTPEKLTNNMLVQCSKFSQDYQPCDAKFLSDGGGVFFYLTCPFVPDVRCEG